MFDPDSHVPPPEPKLNLLRSLHHRGAASSEAEPGERAGDSDKRRGRGIYRTRTRHLQPGLSQDAEGHGEGALMPYVYMRFTFDKRWTCDFTNQFTQQRIRTLRFTDAEKIRELAQRGNPNIDTFCYAD